MKSIYSKNDGIILEYVVGNELRKLVNEYDDDTGKRPGKRRLASLPVLTEWRRRFTEIQDKGGAVEHGHKAGPLLIPDKFRDFEMEMTDTERTVISKLLLDAKKSYQRFYSSMSPQCKEYSTICSLLVRLQAENR